MPVGMSTSSVFSELSPMVKSSRRVPFISATLARVVTTTNNRNPHQGPPKNSSSGWVTIQSNSLPQLLVFQVLCCFWVKKDVFHQL
jgi:hypothetical protein